MRLSCTFFTWFFFKIFFYDQKEKFLCTKTNLCKTRINVLEFSSLHKPIQVRIYSIWKKFNLAFDPFGQLIGFPCYNALLCTQLKIHNSTYDLPLFFFRALLACGIVNTGVKNDCDPALALLSDYVDHASSIMTIGAIFGLGLAYAGSNRSDLVELLLPVFSGKHS